MENVNSNSNDCSLIRLAALRQACFRGVFRMKDVLSEVSGRGRAATAPKEVSHALRYLFKPMLLNDYR
jgi:hypothetical protein